MDTTRRSFLKTAVVGTAATACGPGLRSEAVAPQAAERNAVDDPPLISVRTTVNGEPRSLEVEGHESTLTLVRERLELTGCKRGCGQGACGACTMQLDGVPVATCLLPVTALEGRSLVTVEGLSVAQPSLHPIQRAFLAEDALQCGFCTPGFVVEAVAFYERWRADNGERAPSREQVAEALSGHLCRCGAYAAIYRAVIAACEGRHEAGPDHGPRHDGRAKVTGEARYTVDLRRPGMLVAKVRRSTVAHGTLGALHWSEAAGLPGVHGFVEMTPVGRKVLYRGQPLVAVAARDEASARAALEAVLVGIEALEPVLDIDSALVTGSPKVYRGEPRRRAANAFEGPLLPESWRGNLRGPFSLFSRRSGAARRRLKDAAEAGDSPVVRASFETAVQLHSCLEPHAVLAEWLADDQLRVYASTQGVRHLAEDLAQRFGLRRDKVEVIADYVGGGFGSKTQVAPEMVAAIELARICGRPVKLVLDRREELTVGGLRPSVRMRAAIADDGGEQPALQFESRSDAGTAVGSATTALVRIHQPLADQDLADWDVTTNGPPGCPFRAPGGPPAYFALEQVVDELALRRGVDAVTLRRGWNENPNRTRIYDWADGVDLWRDRPPAGSDRGRFRRGVGLATASWFYFAEPRVRVQVEAGPEGIAVSTACQDIGNGSRSVLADAVAEVFGIDAASIDVAIGSSRGVHGPLSAGSRTATSLGPAAIAAAEELRAELVELASSRLRLREARAVDGGVAHRDGQLSWAEVLEVAPQLSATGKRGRDKGGFFLPPFGGLATGRYLSCAGQVSEVEVDTRLGRVRVLQTRAAFCVGRVYSPVLARSQAEGGMVQGISFALYEERRRDPRDGGLLSGGLEDYRIAGMADVGSIEVEFLPGGFETVRGGGVGLGEVCTLTPAATLANAVRHATGWRPDKTPLRPDRVLEGLAEVGA